MNRNRLLFIGVIALALGLLASLTVYDNLKAKSHPQVAGIEVLVAAKDIPVGDRVKLDAIRTATFPVGLVPANAARQKSEVLERGVVSPIYAGEWILKNKLAPEKGGAGLPSLIPAGMRAVSVRVNDVVAVAGFVQPDTRVDVILTGNPGGGGEQRTTTVLKNIRVLAAGQKMEGNAAGEAENASVITLAVSPDDAQKLTLASTQGKIQLSLRNPLDTGQQDLAVVNADSLYHGGAMDRPAETAPRPRPKAIKTVAPPPAPSVYTVEIIKGDKKEEHAF
jgi:pilus assembly protein CpaB